MFISVKMSCLALAVLMHHASSFARMTSVHRGEIHQSRSNFDRASAEKAVALEGNSDTAETEGSQEEACHRCIKLPSWLKFSGSGFLWEYYHFVIDFAPMLYSGIRSMTTNRSCAMFDSGIRAGDDGILRTATSNSRTDCTMVYANGPRTNLLSTSDPDEYGYGKVYHIPEKWNFLFEKPLNMRYQYVGKFEALPSQCLEVPWNEFGQWSSGPAASYLDFRQFVFSLAGVSFASPTEGILLLRRGKMGARRRTLPDEFYGAARGAAQTLGIGYKEIDLEPLSIEEQVQLFGRSRVVVGQHGAALSNIMLMQPGTTVIEIGERLFRCYQNLAQKVEVNYVAFQAGVWTDQVTGSVKEAYKKDGKFDCPTSATACLPAKL